MEAKEFIEKTNNIVNFLVNAAGQDNYMSAARIITKQAEMDCDGLIEECNEVITMMEKNEERTVGHQTGKRENTVKININ